MPFLKSLALGLSLAGLLTSAVAAPVDSVAYTSVTGSRVNFEDLTLSNPDGTLFEGLLTSGGVTFGERFAGQELALTKAPRLGAPLAQDWFDDLSFGSPTSGLTLLAGATGANLGGYLYGDSSAQALAGIGVQNSDGSDAFGFGAISARFTTSVSALGLQLRETNGGSAWLALYRTDGSLIQTVALSGLQDGYFAWSRSTGAADIAGFSLYNADSYYGVAIDNLVLGAVATVPEPSAAWLLMAGLCALRLGRKKAR